MTVWLIKVNKISSYSYNQKKKIDTAWRERIVSVSKEMDSKERKMESRGQEMAGGKWKINFVKKEKRGEEKGEEEG